MKKGALLCLKPLKVKPEAEEIPLKAGSPIGLNPPKSVLEAKLEPSLPELCTTVWLSGGENCSTWGSDW